MPFEAASPGDTVIDLAAPETIQDPYPAYRWLRDEAPVHFWEDDSHERGGAWVVSRYEDVRALFTEPRLIKRSENVGFEKDISPPILMFMDPPEHTRLRKPVTATFTRRRVEDLRDAVRAEVAELSRPLADGATVEVIETLARPLPLHTIIRLLGIEGPDALHLHTLGKRILDGADMATRNDPGRAEAMQAAVEELRGHMASQASVREQEPRDDLISSLVHAEVEGRRLAREEVAFYGTQLFVNGHETTINLIASMLFRLLSDREQWERLVADPELAASAVEEALRYDAPTQRSSGYTAEPLTLHGTTIPVGEQVMSVIGAANHDDRVFHRPDVLDVGRSPNPHLSFGHGRHHCPGAALSRLQAEEVLRHLAAVAPDLELAGETPRWRPNSFNRGLAGVTVARGG